MDLNFLEQFKQNILSVSPKTFIQTGLVLVYYNSDVVSYIEIVGGFARSGTLLLKKIIKKWWAPLRFFK